MIAAAELAGRLLEDGDDDAKAHALDLLSAGSWQLEFTTRQDWRLRKGDVWRFVNAEGQKFVLEYNNNSLWTVAIMLPGRQHFRDLPGQLRGFHWDTILKQAEQRAANAYRQMKEKNAQMVDMRRRRAFET